MGSAASAKSYQAASYSRFLLTSACALPLRRSIERLESPAAATLEPLSRASRLSESATVLLNAAVCEADLHNDPHVGTEHIVLALARASGSGAATTLRDLGFTPDRAEAALRAWI